MIREGSCWDKAPVASVFNSYKNERLHGSRYETRAEAFDCIEPFCNRRRQHSALGNASPRLFLEDRIRRQHEHE